VSSLLSIGFSFFGFIAESWWAIGGFLMDEEQSLGSAAVPMPK